MDRQGAVSTEVRPQQGIPASPELPRNITSLTSMRFFAAFLVVLYHFKDKAGFSLSGYTLLIEKSYLAVDFFFILSGFIMAHSYINQIAEKRFVFLDYMKRRFARIYPVHLVMLLAFCLLGLAFHIIGIEPNIPEKYSIPAIPINILLLQAWGFTEEGTYNTPSWSISAEWFAYLLFLPMCMMLLRIHKTLAFIACSLFLAAYYLIFEATFGTTITALAHNFGIVRIVPEFLYGIACYLLLRRFVLSHFISAFLTGAGLTLLVIGLYFGWHDLATIYIFGLVIFSYASRARYHQKGILDHRVMIYLGEISYSMYMTHALIYTVFFNGADLLWPERSDAMQTGVWLLAVLLVFPAAIASYHAIEEPGRHFINEHFKLPKLKAFYRKDSKTTQST